MTAELVTATMMVQTGTPWLTLGVGASELVRVAVMVVVGIPILIAASGWVRRTVGNRYSSQQGLIAGKLLFYPGIIILAVSVLSELGFGLAPLLGAAGIVGIAIGFASQTSVSNVISGFFLIAERPFEVDDVIQVGETVGRVLSIDTLSVKLRTFDNRYVRIPNETIVKSQVTTITRFPIRRLDLSVGVAYREDISVVRKVLLDVAARNPRALMEPAPAVFFEGYGDSALEFRLAVWAAREKFIELKNTLLEEVKHRFDEEGIEIPFPHRTLFAGLDTPPMPVRVVDDRARDESPPQELAVSEDVATPEDSAAPDQHPEDT
jgi:small-conductance mechanosensitive channel